MAMMKKIPIAATAATLLALLVVIIASSSLSSCDAAVDDRWWSRSSSSSRSSTATTTTTTEEKKKSSPGDDDDGKKKNYNERRQKINEEEEQAQLGGGGGGDGEQRQRKGRKLFTAKLVVDDGEEGEEEEEEDMEVQEEKNKNNNDNNNKKNSNDDYDPSTVYQCPAVRETSRACSSSLSSSSDIEASSVASSHQQRLDKMTWQDKVPCRDCLLHEGHQEGGQDGSSIAIIIDRPSQFYANNRDVAHDRSASLRLKQKQIPGRKEMPHPILYLPLIVPPVSGSTALEGVIASSPSVSTMCKMKEWQCESTWTLIKNHVLDKKLRWEPNGTNWTMAYDKYHELNVWGEPRKSDVLSGDVYRSILVDKSPPNIAKTKSLVEYFESSSADYRMIIMMRHPCRTPGWMPKDFTDGWTDNYANYVQDILTYVPAERRFLIDYDDLLLRPQVILPKLLKWLPSLLKISLDMPLHGDKKKTTSVGRRRRRRDRRRRLRLRRDRLLRRRRGLKGLKKELQTVDSYIVSDKCLLSNVQNATMKEAVVWEKFLWEMEKQNDAY